MDPIDKNYSNDDSLRINEASKSFLLETAKWAKFLSIVGFVFIGLIVLGALFVGAAGSAFGGIGAMGGGLIAFIYILIAVLYFFPIFYLFKASVALKEGLLANDEGALTNGFENLKSHYKFVGILTIVILSFYVLVLLIAMLGAL
ncbi:MAG: DUF5362 family protein [Flavobacteriales bacterium]